MTAHALTSAQIEALGWTLVHFLWQGAVLGLALYVVLAFTSSARTRYMSAAATLGVMACAPLITFFLLLSGHQETVSPSKMHVMSSSLATVAGLGAGIPVFSATRSLAAVDWINYLVAIWLIGVMVFALRALGGYLVLRRLMREKCEPLAVHLQFRCRELQQRLGLRHAIRFCQSRMVDVPSVIGWFRPVVLVPLSALSGLSPQQLEAVLLHELAHIQRFDSFVNLFQISVETLLFYHPAVWWVSRTIRNERELCCDDIAIAASGNAGEYAHALALMDTWRRPPALAQAATNGVLKTRIARILGFQTMVRAVPHGGLALIGCVCLAGMLLGASNFSESPVPPRTNATSTPELAGQVAPLAPVSPLPPAHPAIPKNLAATAPSTPSAPPRVANPELPIDEANDEPPDPPSAPDPPDLPSSGDRTSYIDGLISAGLKDLDVNKLIALKVQGVTPEYVRAMRATGFHASADQMIALKIQGVTPDYVRLIRATWPEANLGQIVAMKVQGVDPAESVRFRQELGLHDISLGQIIAFRVQGITPEYVRGLHAAGFNDISSGQIIAAKVQGITPEFVKKVHDHGFTNLSLDQLLALKNTGVF